MIKSIFLCLAVLIIASISQAQVKNIQIELLGNSLWTTVSFEHQFKKVDNRAFFYRVGFMYLPIKSQDYIFATETGIILGSSNHHFELSTGISAIYISRSVYVDNSYTPKQLNMFWVNRIGYRYQSVDGRFIYRIGFTPLAANYTSTKDSSFGSNDDGAEFSFRPFGGMSFGYVLRGKHKK